MDEFKEGGNHAGAKEALGNQVGVVGVPLLTRVIRVQAGCLFALDNDPRSQPEDNPDDKAHVGETIRQVPQVAKVAQDAMFVHLIKGMQINYRRIRS